MMHLFIDDRRSAEICEHITIKGLDAQDKPSSTEAFLVSKFDVECDACGTKHKGKLYSHKKR